jgi:hypothetical protein
LHLSLSIFLFLSTTKHQKTHVRNIKKNQTLTSKKKINSKKIKVRREFNINTRISIKIGSQKKKKTCIASKNKKKKLDFLREKTKWVFLLIDEIEDIAV